MTASKANQRATKKLANTPPTKDAATFLQEERSLLIGILDTLSQSRRIDEYLEKLAGHLKEYSGCHCVGIRLLDNEGNIPYVSYTGFSQEFYELENPLCVQVHKCMCISVISEDPDPSLPYYTDGGSFLTGSTTELLASISREARGQIRNVCNQYGYESVALVPMMHKDRILGLIHLADEIENRIPEEKVRFLEKVGAYIGEALQTFMAEEALRESEEHYSALVGSLTDAVFKIKEGMITWCNDTAETIYGYGKDELIGKEASFFYPGHTSPQEFTRAVSAGIKEQGVFRGITRFLKKDGSIADIEYTISQIPDKDPVEVVAVARDVTERKKLDQLKDEFIGLVSHELRSPLTVVIGAVNTALTEAERLSPEETRQLLQDAASEADSLSHLLGNLLELSRVQADRLVLYVEPINIGNAVQDIVEKIRQRYPAHRFLTDLPKGLPPVHADQLRVERILHNLLENAVKYSPQGGEIRVSVRPEKERLVVDINDQGMGISAQDQAKLFEPFQRLEDSIGEGIKGIGLGLLVCRRLVEAHGGQIWVESEPGQGTTFFFTLPLGQTVT